MYKQMFNDTLNECQIHSVFSDSKILHLDFELNVINVTTNILEIAQQ